MDTVEPGPTWTSIRTYLADCRALSAEEFRTRHGGAFLLLRGSLAGLQRPADHPQWTLAAMPCVQPEAGGSSELDQALLPVRPRRPDRKKAIITLGRAETSDVCVPDASVSVYHAFFLIQPDGGFGLQDAGSKNGSFLDGRRVPAQGKGPPCPLESGSDLRFGNVGFQFLLAAELQRLVRAVLG